MYALPILEEKITLCYENKKNRRIIVLILYQFYCNYKKEEN